MKSKIKVKEEESIEYPCLMEHNDGTIILFIAEGNGVCVSSGGYTCIGNYSQDWRMSQFLYTDKKVELSN